MGAPEAETNYRDYLDEITRPSGKMTRGNSTTVVEVLSFLRVNYRDRSRADKRGFGIRERALFSEWNRSIIAANVGVAKRTVHIGNRPRLNVPNVYKT